MFKYIIQTDRKLVWEFFQKNGINIPIDSISNICPSVCDEDDEILAICCLYSFTETNCAAIAFPQTNSEKSVMKRGKGLKKLIDFAEHIAKGLESKMVFFEVPSNLLKLAKEHNYKTNHVSYQTYKVFDKDDVSGNISKNYNENISKILKIPFQTTFEFFNNYIEEDK